MGIIGRHRCVETGAILPLSRFGRGILILPCRGAMGIAGGLRRVEIRVTPSVFFSIPRRREFCPSGDLGSSFRPFPGRCPRSNGSAREPSGPHLACHRETALQPHRVHPPEWCSSSLESQPRIPRVDGSERGGQRLSRPRDPTAGKPARPNRRGVRSFPRPNPYLAVRSGCCRYWFEKQPEGESRRSATGAGVADVCALGARTTTMLLARARERASQFPLHPYTRAIFESERYRSPWYSKPSSRIVALCSVIPWSRLTTVPAGGSRGSRAAPPDGGRGEAGVPARNGRRLEVKASAPSSSMRARARSERPPSASSWIRQARRFLRKSLFRERAGCPKRTRYFSASSAPVIRLRTASSAAVRATAACGSPKSQRGASDGTESASTRLSRRASEVDQRLSDLRRPVDPVTEKRAAGSRTESDSILESSG
jgi:hypothetical protein